MPISLENVNVSRTFTEPLNVPIMHSRTLLIDCMEYVWGLNRGQMSSYFNVPGNLLHIQPELKDAILHGEVALVPPNHVVHGMVEFQSQNRQLPFDKRRVFTEVFPFSPSECRVVPLNPDVSLYALNPTTHKVTALKDTKTSFPTVSCTIHPFFLITYACREALVPPKSIADKLGGLGNTLIKSFNAWHTTPPLEFYERAGAFMGQFGRNIPYHYRALLPTNSPVPESSSSESSAEDSEPSGSKRSRLSTPDAETIAKWVSDCAEADFEDTPELDVLPCHKSPEEVGRRNAKRKRS